MAAVSSLLAPSVPFTVYDEKQVTIFLKEAGKIFVKYLKEIKCYEIFINVINQQFEDTVGYRVMKDISEYKLFNELALNMATFIFVKIYKFFGYFVSDEQVYFCIFDGRGNFNIPLLLWKYLKLSDTAPVFRAIYFQRMKELTYAIGNIYKNLQINNKIIPITKKGCANLFQRYWI